MPTKITRKDVTVAGTTVIVGGSGGAALAQSLVQKNAVTLAELAHQFGYIDPSHITIGADGSVRINNPQLAKQLQANAARASEDDGAPISSIPTVVAVLRDKSLH